MVMRSGDASRVEFAGGSERIRLACASVTCDWTASARTHANANVSSSFMGIV